MGKRIREMDIMRGLATIAVIVIHVSAAPLVESCRQGSTTLFYLILNIASRFAVPVFIMLSGMGLELSHKSDEGYLSYVRHRLAKIAPAYVMWAIIYSFILDRTAEVISIQRVTISSLASDLITGNSAVHLYFVPLIIQLYLLFPLIRKVLRTKWGLIAACLVSVGLLAVRTYMVTPEYLDFLFDARNPFNWIIYFAMGIWLSDMKNIAMLRNPRYKHALSLALIAAVAAITAMVYPIARSTNMIDAALDQAELPLILFPVLFMVWVWKMQWANKTLSSALSWISRYSYGIYLSHILVLLLFMKAYERLGFRGHGVVFAVGSLIFIPLVSALLGIIGEAVLGNASRIFSKR